MKPRIKKVVQGVSMALGHDGLAELLRKEAKVDVTQLEKGELVLCLNQHGDKLKVIGHGGLVVGYLKNRGGERLMMDALQYIPETFGGAGFSYEAAVRKALDKRFAAYEEPKRPVGPLQTARASAEARA